MSAKLAHQTQKTAGIGNGMRTATITAVSPVTISVSGGEFSSGVGVLGSYLPKVGDVVAVFRQDSSWLILGSTSPSVMIETGSVNTGPVAAGTFSTAVVFDTAFPATPVVMVNCDTLAGPSSQWSGRGTSRTPDGFNLSGTGPAATFTAPWQWVAIYTP